LEDERRQLHRAIEKEHRYLMAEKAKMAIGKRLAASDPQSIYITEVSSAKLSKLIRSFGPFGKFLQLW
jgi:hypothetical protein